MAVQSKEDNTMTEFYDLAPPIGDFKMKPLTREEERAADQEIEKGEWIEDEALLQNPAFAHTNDEDDDEDDEDDK